MGKKKETFALKPRSKDPSYRRVQGNFPAKKYKKGTPVVNRLSFEFTGNTVRFIDLAKALSIVNRKLFRQGVYYYVNSVEMYDNETGYVDLFTAPDNWVTRAAHRRGKAIFDDMNEDAIRTVGNLYPMYHDFKVYLNREHAAEGDSILPSLYDGSGNSQVKAGNEWAYSKMVSKENHADGSQAADSMTIHLIGSHQTDGSNFESVGLIESYADTRMRKNTDGTPTADSQLLDDPLLKLMSASPEIQTTDVVQYLDEDNDQTPYSNDLYVGQMSSDNHHVARLGTVQDSNRVTMGAGFCAPCGLVMVVPETGGTSSNAWRLVFNLAVGTYNGVYAERI